jgi:hypothetical protein
MSTGRASAGWRHVGRGLLRVLAGLGVLLLFVTLWIGYVALQPRTTLTGCTVDSIEENARGRRSLPSLTVHGSCGEMTAPTYYRLFIEPGMVYDFTVRGWSWERPTIVEVDVSR